MNLQREPLQKRSRKHVEVTFVADESVPRIENIVDCKSGKKQRVDSSANRTQTKISRTNDVKIKNKPNNIDSDDSENDEDVHVEKPVGLFEEGDVPGSMVFGFHTPKRKSAMVDKATESLEKRTTPCFRATPKTPTTGCRRPSSALTSRDSKTKRCLSQNMIAAETDEDKSRSSNKQRDSVGCRRVLNAPETITPKTPYSLRARLKDKIAAQVQRNVTEFDSEDSEDDFVPSEKSDSSDSNSEDLVSEEEPSEKGKVVRREVRTRTDNTQKRKDIIYEITVDEYFDNSRGKKNKTSNHTLSKLRNPRLQQEELNKLLDNAGSKVHHQIQLDNLCKENCSTDRFEKWCLCLREGYSVLLYGLGSKRDILNIFHQKVLINKHVLVINGFFPGLSIKEIIDSLCGDLLSLKDVPSQLHQVVELIEAKLSWRRTPPIFIIIHNLDGIMLRCDKTQAFIAHLASIPKCYIVASVDHINAPLLWDDKKLSEFNFVWEDVTSYAVYNEETSYENSLLIQRSGALVLASLKNVFQSLTKNGKEIFKILLNDSLQNKKNSKYGGIGFSKLYWKCREEFLVSTDLALRSQLTEFIDHQLVKWRKDSDHLLIPLEIGVLQQFKDLIQDDNE